jgi:riboflavin kinase / FMN adenylyltransferase
MKVFHKLEEIAVEVAPRAVAIGNFDGVHRGHQALLAGMQEAAVATGATPAVLTFYPHPVEVLRPGTKLERLTTTEEKLAFLEKLGIGAVLVAKFDQALADLTPEEFFRRYLAEGLRATSVHVGFNFSFGKRRAGNTEVLGRLCAERKIDLRVQQPFLLDGVKVDSTDIRRRLTEGDVEGAAHWLGRPYSLSGRVAHGDHRGTALGFPTANVSFPWDKVLPKNGVYLTRARWQRQPYRSVTNVGVRPTFAGAEARVEVHLLEMAARLYDESLRVEFLARLRDEVKFDSVDALKAQIRADVEAARSSPVFDEKLFDGEGKS